MTLTRRGLVAGGLTLAAGTRMLRAGSARAESGAVTIAFNVGLPAWDPTVGGSAVNPTIQAIYQSVFDQFIGQDPDLSFAPGILEKWGWNDAGNAIWMDVRKGVVWHDGSPLTPDDIVWSLTRAGDPKGGNPIQFIWGNLHDFKVEGQRVTAQAKQYDPVLFKWMAFLTGYVLPRAYYEKVGPDGFVAKPIGSGPFRLLEYERGARIVLGAYEGYWRGPAKIKRLIFQIVKDPVTRAAAIQSGQADITINLEVREVERLSKLPGLAKYLDSNTGITFVQMVNEGVLKDKNVRLACHHALDKVAISRVLFGGHATPVWLPAGPGMVEYVPGFKIKYDPKQAEALLAKSGYSRSKPVQFKFYTTKGVFPADYDMARIIVQMWRKVGIEADLQPLEAAQFAEYMRKARFDGPVLKAFHPDAGDPATYSGFMLDPKSFLSIWKSDDIPPRLYPLMQEVDEKERIKGFQKFDMWAVEQGYSIPMFMGLSTVVAKTSLHFIPYRSGILNPYGWSQPI